MPLYAHPQAHTQKKNSKNMIGHLLPKVEGALDDWLMNGKFVQYTVRCGYDTTFIALMKVFLSPQFGFFSKYQGAQVVCGKMQYFQVDVN